DCAGRRDVRRRGSERTGERSGAPADEAGRAAPKRPDEGKILASRQPFSILPGETARRELFDMPAM
ncbi:MAG: hypothetical protein LUE08_04205, partial [Akkermansiaceae bacterium]|nr:hypothetical protein [Akkermansiaceae bacterium]